MYYLFVCLRLGDIYAISTHGEKSERGLEEAVLSFHRVGSRFRLSDLVPLPTEPSRQFRNIIFYFDYAEFID